MTTTRRLTSAEPGRQSMTYNREFDATPTQVFVAHTDPVLLARWTGPRGTELTMREFDARTGGCWSYVISAGDERWSFHGSFHEVTPPSRIVQTFEFEGDAGHPSLDVLTFTALAGGRCRLDGLSVFLSTADRDAMLADMDSGMDENFERLDAVLAGTG